MTFKECLVKWNKGREEGAQKNFAKAIGVEVSNVSQWVNGHRSPSDAFKMKIAKELRLSMEAIDKVFEETLDSKRKDNQPDSLQEVPISYIPVIGYVSAETFNCVFEDITPMEVLPVPMMKGSKARALKVSGDCMEPAASDGDYVVVAQKAAYENGMLIVAKVDGECTLKRIYVKDDKVLLIPDNKKYKRLEVKKEDLCVVGVVIFTIRKQAPKKL